MCKIGKYLLNLLLVGLVALTSCDDGDRHISIVKENVDEKSPSGQFSISEEEALNNLYSFWGDQNEAQSRSFQGRTVKSISPISYSSVKSRTIGSDCDDCENVLYIANFENEMGYAILAADSRIEDKVIAVVEEGSMSDKTMYSALGNSNSDRPVYDKYPLTGEGFFTLPEYGDELFMNPNTVELYNDTIQDTLVGNFFTDDNGAVDDDGKPISRKDLADNPIGQLVGGLCMSYALDEIAGGRGSSGNDPLTPRPNNPNDPIYIDGGSDGLPYNDTINDTGWTLKSSVNPILEEYRMWHQSSPFNDKHPRRRKFVLVGHQRRSPAGCFPLAISKLMAHFRTPSELVNWDELCNDYKSALGREAASTLLKHISDGCHSWYFYEGTFTFPSQATSFMRSSGFSSAHNHSYDFDRVEQMLSNDKPIIISSIPGINLPKSHAWNIDGYKIKERKYTVRTFCGQSLQSTRNITETKKMVHCDFGWGGSCNGYYASGVFKLNSPEEKDPSYGAGNNTHFNHLIKIIDYNKP